MGFSLDAGLSGSFGAVVFLDDPPIPFEVIDWNFDPPKLQLRVSSSPGSLFTNARAEARIVGAAMTLVVKGPDWKVEFQLRRESDYLPRFESLQRQMNEQREAPPE